MIRLILLGLLGAAIGGQINRAIYRWAWNKRSISPWSAPPEKAAKRTWWDCVPVFGWRRVQTVRPQQGARFSLPIYGPLNPDGARVQMVYRTIDLGSTQQSENNTTDQPGQGRGDAVQESQGSEGATSTAQAQIRIVIRRPGGGGQ